MRKWIAALLLCCLAASMGVPAFADAPQTQADGQAEPMAPPEINNVMMGILYEESTDTILFTKAPDRRNAPASMTKVMTALLVLEYDPELSGEMVVPPEAVSEQYCYWMDSVHLLAGEEITVWDLMNYLLIVSGNEAATTLAVYVAGDIPTFVEMMNEKAQALGMTSTHYNDPHGLSEENVITCEDMLILCREAMKNETFRKIVSSTSGVLPISNKRDKPYRYSTTNRVMLPRSVKEYDGGFSEDIIGIKTGYISVAGLNLSCCMQYEDMTFYSVVMHGKEVRINGEERSGHYMDTVQLMTYARTFHRQGFSAGEQVTVASTKGSRSPNLPVNAKNDVWILVQEDVEPEITLNQAGRSVKAGDIVGKATFTDAFGNVRETDLVAAADAATSLTAYYIAAAAVVVIAAVVVVVLLRRKGKKAA